MRCFVLFLSMIFGISGVAVAADSTRATGGDVILSGAWGKLWSATATLKVMQDTRPSSNKAGAVRISAARNEYEPFQIVLLPSKELKNVSVTAHRLLGPNGAKIEAWNVSVRRVEYVRTAEPTSLDVAAGLYPDPLPEFAPFSAPAGVNSPIWITVYVSDKAVPGNYKSTVDVSADGLKTISIPVELHVWNFALPSVSKLRTAYGCGFDGPIKYQAASTLEQKRKLLDLYNMEFWRHRISPFTPYAFYDVKVKKDGDQLKVDFSDFDIAVQKYFPFFNSYILPHCGMADNLGLPNDDNLERSKIDYMRALAEHLADKGQISKGYNYITDKPAKDQYSAVADAAEWSGRPMVGSRFF